MLQDDWNAVVWKRMMRPCGQLMGSDGRGGIQRWGRLPYPPFLFWLLLTLSPESRALTVYLVIQKLLEARPRVETGGCSWTISQHFSPGKKKKKALFSLSLVLCNLTFSLLVEINILSLPK